MKIEARLKSGVIWNIAGFGITAVLGVIINIFVMMYGDSAILGVYNQLTAYYAVLGQLASCGMQQAGVYFLSKTENKDDEEYTVGSMLLCCIITGTMTTFIMYLLAGILNRYIYHDLAMLSGIRAVALAAIPFGLNKCILGILNAYRKMERFSVLMTMRYIVILLVILVTVYQKQFYNYGIYCFFIAEMVTIILGARFLLKEVKVKRPKREMVREQLWFGGKAVVGGVVNQLNTKVDILVLGIFCANDIVGIYSFAAMLAEGFLTILQLVRANINPVFAQMLKEQRRKELMDFNIKIKKYSRLVAFVFQGLIMVGYYILCNMIRKPIYLNGLAPLTILLTTISIATPQFLKGNLQTLAGRPQIDSMITIAVMLSNIVFNVILVQWNQLIGVSVATAFSYVIYMFLVEESLKKYKIIKEETCG